MARILVIDDDRQLRLALRRMLEHDGHEVDEADDGTTGLAHFEAHPADVVLVDLYMPGRDGWETLALLRAVAPTVRVLFVSGGGALHSAARGVRPASDGVRFLRKPFDWAALREAMDALLDHPT